MEIRHGVMVGNSFISCPAEPTPEALAEIEEFKKYLRLKGEGADVAATFKEWRAEKGECEHVTTDGKRCRKCGERFAEQGGR